MRPLIHLAFFCLMLAGLPACSLFLPSGIKPYRPHEENLAAREWFSDARFGLFIHWGPQALARMSGEQLAAMTAEEYAALCARFNPRKCDPEQWVGLAKFSGARYITFSAKHASGFAMFDSRHSTFDVMDATPFKRDVVAELHKECNRQGLRLFLQYSRLDRQHPAYATAGQTGRGFRPALSARTWDKYLDYQNSQLRELLETHSDVAGIRLDDAEPGSEWKLRRTYDLIHELQPGCLVGNNHRSAPNAGEDFIIFDRTLPGATGHDADMPLEFTEPLGHSWDWNPGNEDGQKSTRDLLHRMIRAAGSNANYLLGVSPDDDGAIPRMQIQRLREMGNWLEIYGPSIFGTRGGPLPPAEWGVTTHQDRKIYIHYLSKQGGSLRFTHRIGEIDTAYQFSTGLSLDFTKDGDDYVFEISERILDPVDTIIVLELEPPREDGGT